MEETAIMGDIRTILEKLGTTFRTLATATLISLLCSILTNTSVTPKKPTMTGIISSPASRFLDPKANLG